MKAVILAAGQGTRLNKYTKGLPKGMLSFMGKTVIGRQIELYRSCGIDDIIIVRGYERDKIKYEGIKYYDNVRYADTNMVESLMTAEEEFDTDIIISYSDIIFEKSLLKKMIQAAGDYAVAVDDNWKYYWQKRYGRVDFDTESLVIDEKDCITELGQEDPPAWKVSARYIGLLKFTKTGLDFIRMTMEKAYREYKDRPWQQSGHTVRKAYMTDLLNAVIKAGKEVKAVHFQNGWIEFDTNEDYEKALKWVDEDTLDIIRL